MRHNKIQQNMFCIVILLLGFEMSKSQVNYSFNGYHLFFINGKTTLKKLSKLAVEESSHK